MTLDPSNTAPVAVIMAGGSGTRFWPLSTADNPKQFLSLTEDRSLLQHAFDRLEGLVPPERILVVTHERFVAAVQSHLPSVPVDNILAEPSRKDTAAAVTFASLVVEKRFGRCAVAVLTADHLIAPKEAFQAALKAAIAVAMRHACVVTFGVPPTSAATGYGYLEVGDPTPIEPTSGGGGLVCARVQRFHEKPDAATAARYLESGRFLWNSGMFVWPSHVILDALRAHLPKHLDALSSSLGSSDKLRAAFEGLPATSIDKGVMERLADIRCVRAPFAWSDVGSFDALGQHLPHDGADNAVRGQLRARAASRNVVWCEDPSEIIALVGVDDLVVVRAKNRTLVARRDQLEDVKKLVESLPSQER